MTDEQPKRTPPRSWSNREREVLQLALSGKTTKEIAYELAIADSTVRVLLARAAAKCGARTRRELLAKAAACDLFDTANIIPLSLEALGMNTVSNPGRQLGSDPFEIASAANIVRAS